jgi:hypothetical protein
MIIISVVEEGPTPLLAYLDDMPEELRLSIGEGITTLTDLLYDKVMENVSGKLLQTKTGELASSVQKMIDVDTDPMIGSVFVDPVSPKAMALEYGGKDYYMILPSKAKVLRFFTKDGVEVYSAFVNHPPSRAYMYLRSAFAEIAPMVEGSFLAAVERAMKPR